MIPTNLPAGVNPMQRLGLPFLLRPQAEVIAIAQSLSFAYRHGDRREILSTLAVEDCAFWVLPESTPNEGSE
jgi:hypothetical protein